MFHKTLIERFEAFPKEGILPRTGLFVLSYNSEQKSYNKLDIEYHPFNYDPVTKFLTNNTYRYAKFLINYFMPYNKDFPIAVAFVGGVQFNPETNDMVMPNRMFVHFETNLYSKMKVYDVVSPGSIVDGEFDIKYNERLSNSRLDTTMHNWTHILRNNLNRN